MIFFFKRLNGHIEQEVKYTKGRIQNRTIHTLNSIRKNSLHKVKKLKSQMKAIPTIHEKIFIIVRASSLMYIG